MTGEEIVNAFRRYVEIERVKQPIELLDLLPAAAGNAPDAGMREFTGTINKLTIGRFDPFDCAAPRERNRLASRDGRLPKLISAAAVGAEIDPLAVMRPAGNDVVGRVGGNRLRLATGRA